MLAADEFRTRLGRSFKRIREDRGAGRSLQLSDLEPRLLLSATPIDLAGLVGTEQPDSLVLVATADPNSDSGLSSDAPSQSQSLSSDQQTREIVFIDSAVPDLAALLDDLSRSNRNMEVFVLDANRDGVDQISEILQNRSDLSSIHIVTHAEKGAVKLGNVWLGESNLDGYAGQVASWSTSLATDADILLYGCDLASDVQGQTFLQAVSELTGADVAASSDDTGHRSYGGDWDLEYRTGAIETDVAFTTQLQEDWVGKLATITVTTFNDETNLNGVTSLREAIVQANAGAGGDTIILSSGTYLLTITGSDDFAFSGDLDIRSEIIIQGAGTGQTFIDAGGIDRVFELRTGSANLRLLDLTIQGGSVTSNGGGIHVQHQDAILNLQNVIVTGNLGTEGAGIYNLGAISLENVVLSNNGNLSTTKGGGLYIKGSATLDRVTIHGNRAELGAGIYNEEANTTLRNVTVSGNTASSSGGGLFSDKNISIINSTFAFNTAGNGGGIRVNNDVTSLLNTIVSDNIGTSSNPDLDGSINSLGFNLIEDSSGAVGLVSSDITGVSARLGSLANHGGATPTHALTLGSAAINAGNATGAPTADQRGILRFGRTDIGAFEFTSVPLSLRDESLINQSTGDQQVTSAEDRGSTHAVSFATDGSYVVVWTSLNQDGSGQGVYARRFDATGTALTNEILVNQSTTNDQRWASVASATNGAFVVTWTSNHTGNPDIYFRRFNANGLAASVETRVNTTTSLIQENSDISMNTATGEFVIVWQGNGSQSGNVDDSGIFGQRYNSSGSTIGGEFRVNTTTSGGQSDVSVSMNANGQFVVVWDDAGGMRFQRFASNGAMVGSQGTSDPSAVAGNGSVAVHSDGSFVVVWREGTAGSTDVYLQRYNNFGGAIDTVQTVAQSTASEQTNPSIAMDNNGNFIVVWEGNGAQENQTDPSGVFGQKYLANGTRSGGEFLVNTTTNGTQEKSSVAMLDINHFVVVWSGNGTQSGHEDSNGVFSRQFVSGSAPTDITLSNASVAENVSGAVIGTVGVVDPDVGDTHAWTVNDARFEIVGNQLRLRTGESLNFETTPSVNLNITVTDQAGTGLTYGETFMINVTNMNEAPTDITLSNASVAENVSGAVIGTVGVVDPDAADTHAWTVNDARFEIIGNQLRLRTGESLNFETTPSVSLNITATDQAGTGLTYGETFMINVTNANEAPTDITLSNASVAENVSGAVVGTVGVVDPDAADTHAWTVNDARFEIVGNQLRLRTGESLNFETTPSVSLNITVTDQAGTGLTYGESFMINVTNANEAPTDITLSNASVAENALGAVIGTVGVVDPDAADTHAWTVNDARFEIIGNQLRLRTGESLNFETTPSVNLNITVTDQAGTGLTYGESFTINVTNANEAPSDISLSNRSLPERTAGATVGVLNVNDPDVGDSPVYSVDDGRFEVANNQLRLRSDQSIDYAQENIVNLVIGVTDQSGHGVTHNQTFSITIQNLNRAPEYISLSSLSIQGNLAGAAVGEVLARDPDLGEPPTLSVNDPRFKIVDGVLRLRPGQSIASHIEPTVDLILTATDERGLTLSTSVRINVTPPLNVLANNLLTTSPVSKNTIESREGSIEAESSTASAEQRKPSESDSGYTAESELKKQINPSDATAVMNLGVPGQVKFNVASGSSDSIDWIEPVQQMGEDESTVAASSGDQEQIARRSSTSAIGTGVASSPSDRMSQELRRLGIDDLQSLSIQSNYSLMMGSGDMWDEMDDQLSAVESQIHGDLIVVGAAGAAASSFTVGVVAWGLRTGFLASGLLAQMPAWRAFDPLLIMQGAGEEGDESLEELMQRHSDALDDRENETTVISES